MAILPVKLTVKDVEASTAAAIAVDSDGAVLGFTIPADSELVAASLTIVAPGDELGLDLLAGPGPAALASSAGPGAPPANAAVAWFTADWRSRRPLTALGVTVTDATGKIAQIKLAEDGPWYPPSPSRLTLNSNQRLPALTATRLLVELMAEAGGVLTPSTATVTALTLQAAARPGDLSVALGPAAPFASHPLTFDAGEVWPVERELLAALQHALGDRGGPVALRLRSSERALLRRVALTLDRVPLVRRWAGGLAAVTLEVPADGAATARVELPADATLEALEFSVRAEFPRERAASSVEPAPPGMHAHRCTPAQSAAQGFQDAPGLVVAGLDLHLHPLSRGVQAEVSLHEDAFGHPAEAPLVSLPLELVEDGDPPWPARWCAIDLPADLTLPGGPFWVVLAVTHGDLLWLLDSAELPTSPAAPLAGAAQFRGADTWRVREIPGPLRMPIVPWARTRVRLRQPVDADPPAPTLTLRWRGKTLAVTPDEQGRVTLGPAQLASFAGAAPGPLELVVASTLAGTVTVADLNVRLAAVRDRFTVGLA